MLLGNKQGFVFYAVVWLSTQRSSVEPYENRIFYYCYFLQGRAKKTGKKGSGGRRRGVLRDVQRCTEIQWEKADSLRRVFLKRSSSITLPLLFRDTLSLQAEKHKNE